MAAKDLIVYVTGISGMCSKGYTGCGKSCLCHQFIYSEYMEESYSTLGQAEFESHAINQQHTIYWGEKEQTYSLSNEEMNVQSISVNFEVFEHTTFYQDGTNEPFHGHDNYGARIFTPPSSFQNKHAFRSHADMLLNPEGYDRKFSLSSDVPVAYLYVVDVSQSCSIFETQMQLISKLVGSIQKTHSCVVVASKFDTHCEKNVKFLESFANAMDITVIKCSSKHNSNVDTAFECLAVKALSLKKSATEAQEVTQKRTWFAESHRNGEYCIKRFSTLSNVPQNSSETYVPSCTLMSSNIVSSCSQDNLGTLNKKEITSRNKLSSRFSKIFHSKRSSKASEHHITMPTTYMQNSTLGLSKLQYKEVVSSCPDLSRRFQRTDDIIKITNSTDVPYSDPKTAMTRPEDPLPPTPYMQPNGINQSSNQHNNLKLHCRSTMPLPLTPLDLAITTDSVSTTSTYTNNTDRNSSTGSFSSSISSAQVEGSSISNSPTFADKTDPITANDKHSDAQVNKCKHDYENVDTDYESILDLLFNPIITITTDGETDDTKYHAKSEQERNAPGTNDIMTSNASVSKASLPSTDVSTSSNTKAIPWFNEDKDNVISDYEFCRGVGQIQQASTDYLTIITTDTSKHRIHATEQPFKQQDGQNNTKQKEDKDSGANIYDEIDLEGIVHADQCTCEHCEDLELKHHNQDMGDYTFMHSVTCPHLRKASQTYDYVDQLYVTMLRYNYKKYCSGIPPRKVKRPGHKPTVDISNSTKTYNATYVNCSNIRRQYGTALLPPRQCHTNNVDKSNTTPTTPPRNIPRYGHYLSAPPAIPTTSR